MSDQALLLWGIGLMAASLLLILAEVFIPSAGIIALVAAIMGVAGIAALFRYDTTWGFIGLLSEMVLAPIMVVFAFKLLPATPFGRRLLSIDAEEEIRARQRELRSQHDELESLVGAEGVALTDLRPVGAVRIEGRRYDALAETTYIPSGARVRVTLAESNQLKVRQV